MPNLGDLKVEIRPATKEYPRYTVIVFKYKHDSIRDEDYWVNQEVRTYHTRALAESFAARF